METTAKKTGATDATVKTNGVANKVENRPNLTGKEAKKDETAKDHAPAETSKAKDNPKGEAEAGTGASVDNQPANGQHQSTKPEVKEEQKAQDHKVEAKPGIKYIKPALNLEQTLKSVSELHRFTIQRLALIGRIKQLEDFEIKLEEEKDELESNLYSGCRLIIEDDKHRQFVTVTPGLIRMVAQYVFDACHEKLAEIEAQIVFPNT